MDVLDKIVNLILQDPFLTATEIARRLGYAEEKTVYYWIDKAHYSGLVAFKRAVLSGQFRSTAANERSPGYGFIPIIQGFSPDGSALLTDQRYRGMAPIGSVHYAWQYDGPNDWIIMRGDWLLLSHLDHEPCKGWCVAFDTQGNPVIRVALESGPSGSCRLVVPQTYTTDASAIPRYLIRHLFRSLE